MVLNINSTINDMITLIYQTHVIIQDLRLCGWLNKCCVGNVSAFPREPVKLHIFAYHYFIQIRHNYLNQVMLMPINK